jgi:hypothetical protein
VTGGRTHRRVGGFLPPYRLTVLPPSLVALAILALGCARIEPPPGGPPDNVPPKLLSVRPESLAVYPNFHGAMEFRFDEVIFEGSSPSEGLGTGDLERLVILSPTTNVPKVSWKRDAIAVEPREGWKPNRVYRIELLPGVFDLRRNRLDSGTVVTFSTGAPLPDGRLRGTFVDWTAGRLAQAALVEAILLPDSLPYRALTDSSGAFDLGPVPRGQYLLYGAIDQNHNFRREFREGWDSVRATTASGGPAAVLWLAVRDTVGPRITGATPADSTGAELTFNLPLDPYQHFDSSNIKIVIATADSTVISVLSFLPKTMDDSLHQAERQRADTSQADSTRKTPADSAREKALERLKPPPVNAQDTAARAILKQRPPLSDRLVFRVGQVLAPGSKYVVQVFGIRNVNGAAADSRQLLNIPVRPPPPADTLKPATPDSTARDSTTAPPPRPR